MTLLSGPVLAKSAFALCATVMFGKAVLPPNDPPKQGHSARDFELKDVNGQTQKLGDALSKGPAVVLFLRGYCDGQCTASAQQMADFVAQAAKFKAENAKVMLIYPGTADGLTAHAKEFLGRTTLPDNFVLLTDPEYTVSNTFHLRWNESGETVYPATFLIDMQFRVRFSKISKSHGERATAAQVLESMKALH